MGTRQKNIFKKLKTAIPEGERIVWIHCASLGEFEQGRPVIEKLGALYPDYKILLTFFSPSGYEVRKDYHGADWVFYLPLDGPLSAKRFIDTVHPSLVIFVKYEFWYYYLKKIKYSNIPLLLISAYFSKKPSLLNPYNRLKWKMLARFDHLFVQTEGSKKIAAQLGLGNITSISGDTRFDRVQEIADQFEPVPGIEVFIHNNKAVVAGSTWPEDEVLLAKAFQQVYNKQLKIIIAPHELSEKVFSDIEKMFTGAVRYSQLDNCPSTANCLIIDNIGMLSRLYKYADVAYVGGGHKRNGVHNVLEAAVYSKVVLFGPYYSDYSEAVGLVESGGGISFTDERRDGKKLAEIISVLLNDEINYKIRCRNAGNFVQSNTGATEIIIHFIQEKRLLTN
ncbi:MAG: 3-deoxy-D-manno-octulosonic acid transferase [Chitinophagaceae bacterium]|nr:3-deoxy-D-manno-octulosonic acid transferase [Chitinophagaceae bacterium]